MGFPGNCGQQGAEYSEQPELFRRAKGSAEAYCSQLENDIKVSDL